MHLWRQHIDDHQLEETHELSPKSIKTSTRHEYIIIAAFSSPTPLVPDSFTEAVNIDTELMPDEIIVRKG